MQKLSKVNRDLSSQLRYAALILFFGLLGYMPLHIFLSTIIGNQLNIVYILRNLKEVVLLVGFVFAALGSTRKQLRDVLASKLTKLILIYCIFTALLGVIFLKDLDSTILGVVHNTRYFVFYLYGLLLAQHFRPMWLLEKALKILLPVFVLVCGFALLQFFVLSPENLQSIGYTSANGLQAEFDIDNSSLERVIGTFREPNSLGAYLVVILLLGLSLFKVKLKSLQLSPTVLAALMLLGGATLYLTFSRSAYLALFIGLPTFLLLNYQSKLRSLLPYFAVGVVALGLSLFVLVPSNESLRQIFLHDSETEQAITSDQARMQAWSDSMERIKENPQGTGPGTSGPASFYNEESGYQIDESYYLQIANEVGVIGLILFTAIILGMLFTLLSQRGPLTNALFASLLGLSVASIFLHVWSNEAVAYLFWGITAIVVAFNPKDSTHTP